MNPDPDEHVPPGQEDLEWGQGIKEKNREKKPEAKYWAISEKARKMIPGESVCKMFCGGKACKYCTADQWAPEQMVIKGIYSEWVTDNILAMARPSDHNIDKYKIMDQFSKHDIKTVINLQMPGEHAHCGYGNNVEGFSYNTQRLMESGMFFYNFAMHDYGVSPVATLLDVVKVMQFAVSQGKVAVHCHAGLGRTGLIIACYLIYNNRVKAGKAVNYVRSRRQKSLQTSQQVKFCHEFETYLQPFFVVFPSKIGGAHPSSFHHFIIRQRNLLHGYEARKLKHIPKIIYVCCERLLELCGQGKALTSLRQAVIDPIPPELISLASQSLSSDFFIGKPDNNSLKVDTLESINESHGSSNVTNSSDKSHTQKLKKNSGISSSSGLSPVLSRRFKSKVEPSSQKGNLKGLDEEEDDDDDEDIMYTGDLTKEYEALTQQRAEEEMMKAEEQEIKVFKEQQLRSSVRSSMVATLSVSEVCAAMLDMDMQGYRRETVDNTETELNKSDEAWKLLASEEDAGIVAEVMWDWLDQLNEPILRAQDISALIEHVSDPSHALMHIEKSVKHFLEYMARVMSKLASGLKSSQESQAVVERLLCHLCQKRLGLGLFHFSNGQFQEDEEKTDVSEKVHHLFMALMELEKSKGLS